MYRVPQNLDLSFLQGKQLLGVAFSLGDSILQFDLGITLNFNCDIVEVSNGKRTTIRPPERPIFLVKHIGQAVIDAFVISDSVIALAFKELSVEFHDSNSEFESFVISGNGKSIVV